MPQLTLNPTDAAALKHTLAGIEVERTASVANLSASADPVARMSAALAAPGLPTLGQPHPTLAGLYVTALAATPAGPNSAAVRITYQSASRAAPPPAGQPAVIEVGATLSESLTSVDASNNPINATVTVAGVTLSQRAQLARLEPQSTLRYSRIETTSPAANAQAYVGKVNSAAVFGGTPGQWMCTAITARSNDAGQTYQTRYDFQFRPNGWQPTVIYIDPATGRPNPNASEQPVTLYPAADFTALGL